MTTTRDPLAVLQDSLEWNWLDDDAPDHIRKQVREAIAQVEALVEGMRDVLNVGRGTSGRIILELDDEARARECLAPFTPGQDSEGGGQ